MSSSNIKAKLTVFAKLALTVSLLYYVITLIDIGELSPLISKLNIGYFFAAITLHVVAFFIMSVRWWLILNSKSYHIHYKNIVAGYYFGLFCNNFLPTSMGGDVVRIVKLRSEGIDTHRLIFSTIFDRAVGLLTIIAMGILGINFSSSIYSKLGNNTLVMVNIVSTIFVLLFLTLLNSRVRSFFVKIIATKISLWNKLNNFIIYSHDFLESVKKTKTIALVILLSFCSQILVVITYYLISKSLHIEVALIDYILLVPTVALFTSLPISVGGLGVRESVLVFLLGTIGVSTTNAVSISLLYLTVLILVTLPGGLFLLSGKHRTENHCTAHD